MCETDEPALVLVGMSLRDAGLRAGLMRFAAPRGATVAFLQVGEPSLAGELTRLADLGHRAIRLVGVSLSPPAPGLSWLRRVAAHWWRTWPPQPARPTVDVATRLLGALDEAQLAERLHQCRELTGSEPGLTCAAWESVPAHRHQVLVCCGPRCTAKGADRSLRTMIDALGRHGLGDDDVLVVQTGCQFPCNHAPVVSVQPDDVWYGRIDPRSAETLVEEHFLAGRPLHSHRLPRRQ